MKNKIFRIILVLVIIVGLSLALLLSEQLNLETVEIWVQNAGIAGPIFFVAIYAIAAVFFLPGSVLTLIGGALFGPFAGVLYNLAGATLGATISFLMARYLASEIIEKKTGGQIKQLKNGIENEGWRFVAFVRLVPIFPFNLLNYALGLTRINVFHYIITSLICMAPAAIAYTYLGYAGSGIVTGDEAMVQKLMLAVALIAVVALLPGFIIRIRQNMSTDSGCAKNLNDNI